MEPKLATAIYDYVPQQYDELAIRAGDSLLVYQSETCSSGWIHAVRLDDAEFQNDGEAFSDIRPVQGLVPENYIQLLDGADLSSTNSPMDTPMESPMDSSSESTIESPNKNGETLNSIPFPGGKAKSSTLRLKFDKAKAFARSSGADFKRARSQSNVTSQNFPVAQLTQEFWFQHLRDPEALLSTITEQEKKYQQAIFEIYTTEQKFVQFVELINEAFMIPLASKGFLSDGRSKILFGNLNALVPRANQKILSALRKNREENLPYMTNIGKIFLKESESFREPYCEYFKNYTKAIAYLHMRKKDTTFSTTIKECESNVKLNKIDLQGYLIMPVQRMMRYPILLRAALDYCPESHVDYPELKEAFQKMSEIVNWINNEKRKAENIEKIEQVVTKLTFYRQTEIENGLIDGERSFLKEGKFYLFEITEETEDIKLFLFNDLLIITKKVANKNLVHETLSLNEIEIFKEENEKQAFEIIRKKTKFPKKYYLNSKSNDEKNWLDLFEKLGVVIRTQPLESRECIESTASEVNLSLTKDLENLKKSIEENEKKIETILALQKELNDEKKEFDMLKLAFFQKISSAGLEDYWEGCIQSEQSQGDDINIINNNNNPPPLPPKTPKLKPDVMKLLSKDLGPPPMTNLNLSINHNFNGLQSPQSHSPSYLDSPLENRTPSMSPKSLNKPKTRPKPLSAVTSPQFFQPQFQPQPQSSPEPINGNDEDEKEQEQLQQPKKPPIAPKPSSISQNLPRN